MDHRWAVHRDFDIAIGGETGLKRLYRYSGLLFAVAALLGASLQVEAGGAYRLGPADRVRVMILEQPTVTGEFTVGPAGTLSIPTVGEIDVAGLEPNAVGELIGEKLGLRAQQAKTLISVEIVEFRPFYITGAVNAPGSYPFVVGMTVLHAVSLAGGISDAYRIPANRRLALLQALQDLRQNESALGLGIARRARLLAEINEQETPEFPAELSHYFDETVLLQVKASEERAARESVRAMETQRQLVAGSITKIEEQIRAYKGQYESKVEEGKLLQEDIAAYQKSGSAVSASDVRQLRRLAAEVRGEQLELEALIARAEEHIESIKREQQHILSRRRQELFDELSTLDSEIADLRIRIEEGTGLLAELRGTADPEATDVGYTIIRATSTGMNELTVSELTPVEPGDLIKITLELGQESPQRTLGTQ